MISSGAVELRQFLARSRLSQRALANLLDVHEATISRLLSGDLRPSLDLAHVIQHHTGIPIHRWARAGQ